MQQGKHLDPPPVTRKYFVLRVRCDSGVVALEATCVQCVHVVEHVVNVRGHIGVHGETG